MLSGLLAKLSKTTKLLLLDSLLQEVGEYFSLAPRVAVGFVLPPWSHFHKPSSIDESLVQGGKMAVFF